MKGIVHMNDVNIRANVGDQIAAQNKILSNQNQPLISTMHTVDVIIGATPETDVAEYDGEVNLSATIIVTGDDAVYDGVPVAEMHIVPFQSGAEPIAVGESVHDHVTARMPQIDLPPTAQVEVSAWVQVDASTLDHDTLVDLVGREDVKVFDEQYNQITTPDDIPADDPLPDPSPIEKKLG
jgi:hypothetical protein